MHVITQDGKLCRTLPCPHPARPAALAAGRPAGRAAAAAARPVIQRKVSSRSAIRVARQRVQVGLPYAGRIVSIEPGDTTLRVIDPNGELLTTVPRTSTGVIGSRLTGTAIS